MMSALAELGRVGLTGVGDDPDEAEAMYRDAEAALLEEGGTALTPLCLPGSATVPERGADRP